MAYVDAKLDFGLPAIANSNDGTISTNVYNAGEAKKLFAAEGCVAKLLYNFAIPSADCTGYKIDVHGTSESDGDVDNANAGTEVLASTGVVKIDYKEAALGSAATRAAGVLDIPRQRVAKQYYALTLTLSGTNPDATAGDAYIVLDGHTSLLGPQESTPGT